MIAGPNGSGKSTLIELLRKSVDLGVYVNADDIEANLLKKPFFHFEDYAIKTTQLPAVFNLRNGQIKQIINAESINSCRTIDDLKNLIDTEIEQII